MNWTTGYTLRNGDFVDYYSYDDPDGKSWAGFWVLESGKCVPYHYRKYFDSVSKAKEFCERYAKKQMMLESKTLEEWSKTILV